MIYLDYFKFLNKEDEWDFIFSIERTCYDTIYPYGILSKHGFERVDFEPITIFYGGNGSGKTTALNIIAEKLLVKRGTLYNKSNFFEKYVKKCIIENDIAIPKNSKIITSDDVFDYMLDIRYLNDGIDRKREDIFEEYVSVKNKHFQFRSMEDYEQLKKVNMARSKTQSKYTRSQLKDNVREKSNGESAFMYFTSEITENALYLLDEPENSLSIDNQLELLKFIEDSVRFYGCQFIISTHSPFLLSMTGAKIYDLDEETVKVKKWTELKNVRAYYDFFKKHESKF